MKDQADPVIMIVGEDSEFVYLMQRYISQRGCQSLATRPDPRTVDVARAKVPLAILIDVESPKAAGWEVLKRLKADRTTQEIPIVVCSWLDEQTHSLQEGAVAYLRKPIMYDDLSTVLTQAGVQTSLR